MLLHPPSCRSSKTLPATPGSLSGIIKKPLIYFFLNIQYLSTLQKYIFLQHAHTDLGCYKWAVQTCCQGDSHRRSALKKTGKISKKPILELLKLELYSPFAELSCVRWSHWFNLDFLLHISGFLDLSCTIISESCLGNMSWL